MAPEAKQLALIYRVYYKCIRTNLNVQALNKKAKGETTLIQTTAPESQIKVPRTLKWSKVTFHQDWTLQNENFALRAQCPCGVRAKLADNSSKLHFHAFISVH